METIIACLVLAQIATWLWLLNANSRLDDLQRQRANITQQFYFGDAQPDEDGDPADYWKKFGGGEN